ncbi:splicing factor ESS-2 homolog [Manduca sexta]|uniref:splicing factor ESS-2 homolog n=1 Tax=Manduca sexta TaxID=7130 RepID=UPI00188F2B5D|nr:splicing factor ESS-2 homolog [Manduca sexta]
MSENDKSPRPGVAALENMKLLKSESSIFKVPKVPKKKTVKKTNVLDEELYVEGIAKIIQRDFFPDLEKLKAQNDFLEATENKDYERLREITRKYSGQRPPTDPYNTPATFDTPGVDRPFTPAPTIREERPESIKEGNVEKPKDIIDNHSLDSFLASHTSEDNASYNRVIALEDKKRATKLAPQLQAEVTSAALVSAAQALPSIEQQADQTERPHELDTWAYKARNYIMYVPDGAESQQPPPKPELVHRNTRLTAPPFDHAKNKEAIIAIARTQDASISGKIGVDGVSLTSEKPGGQYSYVATPSPRPGEGPDQSPLMTWGEIEGTPFRLDGGDTPLPAVGAGAAYRMLEGGARERIALQLADRAARRRRAATPRHDALLAARDPHSPHSPRTPRTPRTPSFRSNTERLASMSPAARKLAAKHLLSPRLKLTPSNMGILSRTPTPKRTPTQTRPLVATPNINKKTPQRTLGEAKTTEPGTENNNLTDNLLQINVFKRTRLKAQDFF